MGALAAEEASDELPIEENLMEEFKMEELSEELPVEAMVGRSLGAIAPQDAIEFFSYTFDEATMSLKQEKAIVSNFTNEPVTVTKGTTSWKTGWYIVKENVTLDEPVTVSGDVNLILMDGCTLECTKGIRVEGNNSLTIYGQDPESDNPGKLIAKGVNGSANNEANGNAGIGSWGGESEGGACGSITIHGGKIEAYGGYSSSNTHHGGGAGIGGGSHNDGGYVTIYGGDVYAQGEVDAAGIGGGNEGSCGNITINGGKVTAMAGKSCSNAIGGGQMQSDSTITPDYNGTITLADNMIAFELDDDDVQIRQLLDASQFAGVKKILVREVDPDSAYITYENGIAVKKAIPLYAKEITEAGEYGSGYYILTGEQNLGGQIVFTGDACLILKNGAFITANGIVLRDNASITICAQPETEAKTGKLTIANVPDYFAGIGGGAVEGDNCGDITINGGELKITGGYNAAGIGGGHRGSCGNITINDTKKIIATGGMLGPGIGGSYYYGCGDITINDGEDITANGGEGCPGIGAGFARDNIDDKCKSITINNGTITANGGKDAPGVGASIYGNCGPVAFNGGFVTATGGENSGAVGTGAIFAGPQEIYGSCGKVTLGTGVSAYKVENGSKSGAPLDVTELNSVKCVLIEKPYNHDGDDNPVNPHNTDKYTITSGKNSKWTKGSKEGLVVTCDGPLSEFIAAYMDGKLIDKSNYNLTSENTVLELKPNYLETLTPGTHKLSLVYSDDSVVSTNIEIVASGIPATGDKTNIALWIALAAGSLLTVILLLLKSRKDQKEEA